MRSLVDAVCGCFLVMAALAAPGAALAAAEDGSDLPKLVVLVVVDGLPQDQVVKYLDQLGEGGFKRLLDRGAWFTNAHYGHSMTETAVGHATIATGAHPYRHGVVGNDWFDRKTKKQIYGVSDPSSLYLGEPTPDSKVGTSPRNLRVLTIGDELRLKTGFRGRVLSISIKDRGAILSGGKLGAAYWLSPATGRFITSTYYRTSNYRTGGSASTQARLRMRGSARSGSRCVQAPRMPVRRPATATTIPTTAHWARISPQRDGRHREAGKEYYEALARTPFGDSTCWRSRRPQCGERTSARTRTACRTCWW
jgi:hypothetical protein